MEEMSVELVTPEKVTLESRAIAIVIPAVDGELGILAHHAPLIAQLQPGEIRIQSSDQGLRHFAVSGGFVEVRSNRVAIFAETAESAEEIDAERARQAAERARSALQHPTADLNLAQTEAALRRALARLRVAEALRRGARSLR